MKGPPPLPPMPARETKRGGGIPKIAWVLIALGCVGFGWIFVHEFQKAWDETQGIESWNRAIMASERGDHEQALRHLDAAAKHDDSADIVLLRASELYELERYDEALAAYKEGLARKDDDGGDWLYYGHTQYALDHLEEARVAYKRSTVLTPECADTWAWLGYTSYESERYEAARDALRRAIQLDPSDQSTQAYLGYTLHQMDEPEESLEVLAGALKLEGEAENIRLWLARVHLDAHRLDDAANQIDLMLAAADETAPVHRLAAELARKRGHYEKAVALEREVTARWPDDPESWLSLGHTLHEKGDLEEAADAFRTAAQLADDPSGARMQLGRVLRDAGHIQKALSVLTKVTTAEPNLAEAWYERGVVFEQAEDWTAAEADYRRALQHQAEFPEAEERLAGVRSRLRAARALLKGERGRDK